MKIKLSGLLQERMPSGNVRYRVRVEGKPGTRVPLHLTPNDKAFMEHYNAARMGVEMQPEVKPVDSAIKGSVAWLSHKHLEDLERRVTAGLASPETLKKRRLLLSELRRSYGEYSLNIPARTILSIRDGIADRPAWADSMIAAIRSMFKFGMDHGYCQHNPHWALQRLIGARVGLHPGQ